MSVRKKPTRMKKEERTVTSQRREEEEKAISPTWVRSEQLKLEH